MNGINKRSAKDLYGLIGSPVKHSISPKVHNYFAEQTQQAIRYELVESLLDDFAGTLQSFIKRGAKGANITLPFKQQACYSAKTVSPRARIADAANTLLIHNQQVLYADNTDGIGLIKDLSEHCRVKLAGKTILVIGAGGAARGIIAPLLQAQVAKLAITNRGIERARKLAREFEGIGDIELYTFAELQGKHFDGIINATSASLYGEMPALPQSVQTQWGYDLVYQAKPTVFMQRLGAQGVDLVFDGLGMLVAQAAESFYLWRGVAPQITPVIDILRQDMYSSLSNT